MDIVQSIIVLVSIFATLIVMDFVWLGILTKEFIIREFGSLVKVENGSIQIKLLVGLMAWFVIALGVLIFVVSPAETISRAALMGAIFGFVLYATYDLTNLTFLTGYSVKFTIVDIIWGCVVCSAISSVGFFVKTLVA